MDRTDEQLIAECALGKRDAFEELYRRYGDRIASYLCRCLGNAHMAEELCQETFARVWMRASQCDVSRGRFRSWLYQIATNLVRTHWRKAKRRRLVGLAEIPESWVDTDAPSPRPDGPEQELMQEQLGRLVGDALKELKPDHRIVIILKYFERMRIREIAASINCSEGTVKSRLHHALRHLGRRLRSAGLCEEDVG